MKHFAIENETNNIIIHTSVKDAAAVPNSERFSSESTLAKLAANWPAARLVEIWNSLPGETPVKKFKDRQTAASRIWKAIQNLGQTTPAADEAAPLLEAPAATEVNEEHTPEPAAAIPAAAEPNVPAPVAPQGADVAPAEAPATKKATRARKAPKTATEPGAPREGSKTSRVIAMLKREGGTTVEQIMTAMQWQKHTTRAMLSAGGSLTKKHGLIVTSEKVGDKRVYSIKA
jgi:hypothetical protein